MTETTENQTEPRVSQRLLYWLGVISSAVCVSLIFASNTQIAWRYEHTNIPASWAAGLIAIFAFLAAEYSGSRSESRVTTELSLETLQQEI
jgi:hypothetical protein